MTTPPTLPGRQPDPDDPSAFEPPQFESFETPSFEEIASGSFAAPEPPPPAHEEPVATEPEPEPEIAVEPEPEPEVAVAAPPVVAPIAEDPTALPTFAAQSYAQHPDYGAPETSPGWGTPAAAAPDGGSDGSGGSGGGSGNRTLIGYLGAVGVLVVVLVLILVYAFVIRDASTSPTFSSTGPTSTTTSESATTSAEPRESVVAPPVGDATEGPFTFAVTGIQTGSTVTSSVNDLLQKTAIGVFVVVSVDVGNTGSDVATFLATLQVLNADGTVFRPDDEASFYVGGGVVSVNPGEVVQTAIAFDVPVGTTPTSIELHGIPGGAGVELPV